MIELYLCVGAQFPEEERALSVFSPYRRARIAAAKTKRGKLDAYAASCALRAALRAHGIEDSECGYEIAPGGKPRLLHGAFHFSLSHTDGGALCALSDAPIGADLEAYPPRIEREYRALVHRFFTAEEQAYFLSHGATAQDFFLLWTRKESYLKYTGQGLACPLSSFCVLESENGASGAGVFYQTLLESGFVISVCTGQMQERPRIFTI